MDIKPVLDRMYADREIYCIQPWCVQGGRLTRAQLLIGMDEQPRVPACCDCARNWQSRNSQPVELWYIDDDLREGWWAAIDGAIGSPPSQPPPPPAAAPAPEPARQPASTGAWWAVGTLALVSFILGGFLIWYGGQVSNSGGQGHGPEAWGYFFVFLPFLAAIIAAVGCVIAGTAKMVVEDERKYKVWKAGLSPEDQSKVWWAETATMWAAWGAVHHHMHERQSRAAASAMGQAPFNNVHAGMKRTTEYLNNRWRESQQQQPDPLRPPFTGTPVSDIYGNVTYRKKPWP